MIKNTFKKIAFMFRYSWMIGPANILCAFFEIVLETAEPFILLLLPKYIIDALVYGSPWSKVLFHTLLYIGVFALSKIVRLVYNAASAHIINGCDIKNSMYYRSDFLNMDYENLENDELRNINQRVAGTVRANTFVYEVFVPTVTNILKFIGYAYIIATLHPLLILFLIGLVLMNSLIAKKTEKINYEFEPVTARFQRKQSYLFGTMIGFDWAKEVRINKADTWLHEKYRSVTEDYMKENIKLQKKHLPFNTLSTVISFSETFVIKGLMALIAFYGYKLLNNKIGRLPSRIIAGIFAEIMMILGYFVFEGFLYGFVPSLVNILANGVQGIAGLIIGVVLIKIFEKTKIAIE